MNERALWRSHARRGLLTLSALASVLMSSACTRGRTGTNEFAPISIQIDNQNFNDATIYLVWQNDRRRLGSVVGKNQATFSSPWYGSLLQIEIDFLAGTRQRGDAMSVTPGATYLVVIPPNMDQRIRVIRR